MNTKTICRLFGVFTSLFLLLVTTNVSAQSREALSSLLVINKAEVNQSVIKSFERKFKNATAVSWYQAKENNVLVKYNENTETRYALFTTGGTLIRQFTYGTENDLPQGIKNLFRDKYWNVTVVNVANVKQNFRNIWIIYAEKGSHTFAVKIEDGEVELLED